MGAGEHNAPSWKLACDSENCLLSSNLNPSCMFSLPGFEEHTLFPSKCEKFNFQIKYVTIARKQKCKALLFHCQLPYIILLAVYNSVDPSKLLFVRRLIHILIMWSWITWKEMSRKYFPCTAQSRLDSLTAAHLYLSNMYHFFCSAFKRRIFYCYLF